MLSFKIMITILGLGNPGEEYENTRHNTGRIVAGILAKKFEFGDWREDKKSKALLAVGKIGKEKATIALPETFMNKSGGTAGALVKSKKDLKNLIVIYDDLDLPIGTMKISFNRGDGGHNGLTSIIKALKSREFVRIRIGISPATPKGKVKRPDSEKLGTFLVEKDFKDAELAEIKKIAKKVGLAIETFTERDLQTMMSQHN